jgi:hypothetical protein
VQTVLAGNLKLHPVEPGIVDPPRNKKKAIEKAVALKLMEHVRCDLLEEIVRRERINQEETIVVAEGEEEDDWIDVESSDEEDSTN